MSFWYTVFMKIAIILGSTRTKFRLGERIAKWVMAESVKYPEAEFELLDLREYQLPFFDEEHGPKGNPQRPVAENIRKWISDIDNADGYIFIVPEYNSSPNAALKNAIDYLAFEMKRKPVVLIGYSDGSNGGMYALIQFRQTISEMDAVALSNQQIILNADKVLDENGNAVDQKESLERRFERMVKELLWYTKALKSAREEK